MTLSEQYEQGSIMEKENARAIQCAINEAGTAQDALLVSRTHPFPNPNLRITGPRWYVRVLHNGGSTLYRVWRSEDTWHSAQVQGN